jgi:putative flippase GtrA
MLRRAHHVIRSPPSERAGSQLVRYGVVAGAGYVLAVAIYALALRVGVPPYAAITVAFVLNGLFNFAMLRLWTFPSTGRRAHSEFQRFVAVAAGSLIINYGSFALLYSVLGLPPTLAQAIAIAIAAPFGFLANRLWSFRASALAEAPIR